MLANGLFILVLFARATHNSAATTLKEGVSNALFTVTFNATVYFSC